MRTFCIRDAMPKRPARITQTEVARVIRAARQAGATEVVVKIGAEASVRIPLVQDKPIAEDAGPVNDADALRWRDGDG